MMATTPRAQIRKPPMTKGNPWGAQPPGLTASTMAQWVADIKKRAVSSWREFVP